MSRFISSLRFLLAGVVLFFAASKPAAAQDYYDDPYGGQATYQQFYDDLSPYGDWVDDPQYGYVWVPDAGDDFRPYYSNGYWANTNYGNTWVSNYRWGWAPFHYGRWTYSNFYGWMWIPGNVWGPAWVSWRSGGGCYGWAPMGPGISINIAIGGGYYAPDYWWNFTPQQYILSPSFHRYSYGPRYNQRYIQQTTIINNTYVYNNNTYITGPRRSELERSTGRPVTQYAVNNISRPDRAQLRGNNLNMYRPAISERPSRSMERPRSFSTTREPIAQTQAAMTRPDRSIRERSVAAPNQERAVQRNDGGWMRPDRSRNAVVEQAPQQPQRQRIEPAAPVEQQRPRAFDRSNEVMQQPQTPMQAPRAREWGSRPADRAPDRMPTQQQAPVQRMERAPFDRGMDRSRAQEMQRPQAQPRWERQPQVMERPQPMQRMEQPRMERSMPQQRMEMPRQQAPMRMERQAQPMPQQRMEAPRSMPSQSVPRGMDRQMGGGDRGFRR